MKPSAYYDPDAVSREVNEGRHRAAIGGLWEEMGQFQLEFLKGQGLRPHHKLLDVGCGALRFGHLAVDYLDATHYYGQDLSAEIIEAGYSKELNEAQHLKLPRTNLAANADFDFSHVAKPVDFAIAQSVFTHLPFNHIRHCLTKLQPHMASGGVFYATYFECPSQHDVAKPYPQAGAIDGEPVVTTSLNDPYHYQMADFNFAVLGLNWQIEKVTSFNHPRGQKVLKFSNI